MDNIPTINDIIDIILPLNKLYFDIKTKLELGIKSVIDIDIIMLKENDKQKVINFLMLFLDILKKITNDPNTVESPAIDDIIKG